MIFSSAGLATKLSGLLLAAPAWMSFRRVVPPVVPSVIHSSAPATPSLAEKMVLVVPGTSVQPAGLLPVAPMPRGLPSRTG